VWKLVCLAPARLHLPIGLWPAGGSVQIGQGFACLATQSPSGPSVWPSHAAYAPIKRNIGALPLAGEA
jgi:hypothetical protein